MSQQSRRVLLFELNEVPWKVLDRYVAMRPDSWFARLLANGRSFTSVVPTEPALSPWRTWPIVHYSAHVQSHNSWELGQDPGTFRGTPLWRAAVAGGRSVGLFGSMQSWPAPSPADAAGYAFYVPDTFAADEKCLPRRIEPFQAFNLKMTGENAFSANAKLDARAVVRAGTAAVRSGLGPRSVAATTAHLLRERRDPRWKAARPIMQVLPAFDLFWRLHKSRRPDLSLFFTNHVASMMHRYWGDAMPDYAAHNDYPVDPVFTTFLWRALDLSDRHLGRMMRHCDKHAIALVVASSMGQDAIAYQPPGSSVVLKDATLLAGALGYPDAHGKLTMYPRAAVELADSDRAVSFARHLATVSDEAGDPIFEKIRVQGRSVVFWTSQRARQDLQAVSLSSLSGQELSLAPAAAGLEMEQRLGGANTAYHVPEGIFIAYGEGISHDSGRRQFDARDISPTLLSSLLKVPVPEEMEGTPRPELVC